jgi:hypothetical protein
MKATKMAIWSGVALVALAIPSPEADADTDSFYAYLRDHGISTGALSASQQINMGNGACAEMHAHPGKTPEQVAGDVPQLAWAAIDGRGVAEAAQHELCPDTLH